MTNCPLRILSIGAHPADIFDQSGGAMAHHAARGDYVACVVLTHGARIHDQVISDSMFHREQVPIGDELLKMMAERSDVKAEEVRKACGILGFQDVYFFGEDDAVLLMTEGVVRRLAAMLRQLRPDIVLTHFHARAMPSPTPTRSPGRSPSTRSAMLPVWIRPTATRPIAWLRSFSSAPAPRGPAASYGTPKAVTLTTCSLTSPTSWRRNLPPMDCLVSQGYGGAYARKRIETSDGAFGQAGGVSYAEGFISLNAETHSLLPVTDHALKRAHSSDHEIMTAYSYRIKVD